MHDALGRVVRQLVVPAATKTAGLNLTELPAGVYVVRCGSTAQRLVVELAGQVPEAPRLPGRGFFVTRSFQSIAAASISLSLSEKDAYMPELISLSPLLL